MNYQKDLSHLIGQKFGKLLILSISDRKIFKSRPRGVNMVLCQCDCGTIKSHLLSGIKCGHTKSCGCFQKEQVSKIRFRHGLKSHPIYSLWSSLKTRCYNSSCEDYKDYGGRGIAVCNEWKNDFVAFYNWSIKNGYKQGLQIDRIKNNGNYEPTNCRFVTNTINARNRRSNRNIEYNGETKTFTEWCEILKLNYRAVKTRVNLLGWDIKKAFEVPIRKRLLFILLILPAFSFSQLTSSISYGYDFNGRAITTLAIGYEKGLFDFQGEIRPSLSRNVSAHNYIGTRLSFNLINPDDEGLYILPGAGYYYDLKSQDKTNLNKWYWGYSLKSGIMLKETAGLFIEGLYINKSIQASIGIRYKFVKIGDY